MPQDILLTGPPRSGKTTVIERVIERLDAQGRAVGGIVSPAIRIQGDRVGFEIVDVRSGETEVMAHVDLTSGPRVGKYRVDIAASSVRPRNGPMWTCSRSRRSRDQMPQETVSRVVGFLGNGD